MSDCDQHEFSVRFIMYNAVTSSPHCWRKTSHDRRDATGPDHATKHNQSLTSQREQCHKKKKNYLRPFSEIIRRNERMPGESSIEFRDFPV